MISSVMRIIRWFLIVLLGVFAALAAALGISLLLAGIPSERELVFLHGAIVGSAGATYLICLVVFVFAAGACVAILRTRRRGPTGVETRK